MNVQRLPAPDCSPREKAKASRQALPLCGKHRAKQEAIYSDSDAASRRKRRAALFAEAVRCEECWRCW